MLNRVISNVKTISLIFLIVLGAYTYAAAQTSCSLILDQLKNTTELFGFRVGMTLAQVTAREPLVRFGRADQFGVIKTSINPHFDTRFDQAKYADVRTISFDFLDGKLVTLWIGYEETFKWPTLDEFTTNFGKALDLKSPWLPKRSGREIACDGFTIFASMIANGPSIRVQDEAAEAEVFADTRTKNYYPADCSARDDIPAGAKLRFKNKEEAEKAGYKLAKDCQ